jgi:hypothetical protein
MNSRFRKLVVESLEGRSVLSTTAFADFNNDGLLDMAALSAPKTITVSLANPDGGYTVSATLTAPKPIDSVAVTDLWGDGTLDIHASGSKPADDFYWLGNGDGSFDYLEPWKPKSKWWF